MLVDSQQCRWRARTEEHTVTSKAASGKVRVVDARKVVLHAVMASKGKLLIPVYASITKLIFRFSANNPAKNDSKLLCQFVNTQ